MSAPARLRCECCGTRKALWTAVDDPEHISVLIAGDQVLSLCLCTPCLEATEEDGPWSAVYRIDTRRPAA